MIPSAKAIEQVLVIILTSPHEQAVGRRRVKMLHDIAHFSHRVFRRQPPEIRRKALSNAHVMHRAAICRMKNETGQLVVPRSAYFRRFRPIAYHF